MSAGHFVHLFRDREGNARYVGYGEAGSRPLKHASGSHNAALAALIASQRLSIEIAGPFGSGVMGRAVETALISALRPDCDIAPGPSPWRFRPLGVPEAFGHRLDEPPLTRAEFLRAQGVPEPGPVLFVTIGSRTFEDGRVGYDPANPPTDPEILGRMDHWWQIGKYVEVWKSRPQASPVLLLGLFGRPGFQLIIGSVRIDREKWAAAETQGAYYRIPTLSPADPDAFGLRGRRVATEAGIRFGPFPSRFFVILDRRGRLEGGRPSS